MKRILLVLFWVCTSAAAQPQTFAEIAITHVHQFVVTASGPVVLQDFDTDWTFRLDRDGYLEPSLPMTFDFSLEVNQPIVTTFDYRIAVSVGGRPYFGPQERYCTPLAFESQCITPGGWETSFAQLMVGYIDPRAAHPFLNLSGDERTLWVTADAPPRVETGQMTASVSTSSDLAPYGSYGVTLFMAVFAAPIPEPSSWALMLGGLVLLGGIARRAR